MKEKKYILQPQIIIFYFKILNIKIQEENVDVWFGMVQKEDSSHGKNEKKKSYYNIIHLSNCYKMKKGIAFTFLFFPLFW